MRPEPFALERYFARFEFSARYLLSSSDCDGWPQAEILALADDRTRALWEDLRLGYTESRGLPLLREEIARLYEGIRPEEILVAVRGGDLPGHELHPGPGRSHRLHSSRLPVALRP